MKSVEDVVCCSGCTKEVTDGRFVEHEDSELVCYDCVEASYQVYMAATNEDVNEALLRMYLN